MTGSDDFDESNAEEHLLVVDDERIRMMRLTVLMQSLDRRTREHLSALIVDMVRQRKTDSEFAALMKILDLFEEQVSGELGEGIAKLIDETNWDRFVGKVNAIAKEVDGD